MRVCNRFNDLGNDGAPAKLGVLGGTFDPIHVGHLRIAEEMREALGLDGVIFMPAGDPVFKHDHQVTDAHVRFERVRQAVLRAHLEEVYREGEAPQSIGSGMETGKTPLTGRKPITGMEMAKKRLEAMLK